MKFSDLQLHPVLATNLVNMNFSECTPIQEKSIPLLRKGKDLSGLAQTGTGKTGAFLLPLIDRLLKAVKPDESCAESETVAFPEWKKKQYILILVPTRELAEQVQENAKKFLANTGLGSVSIYGGTTYEKQIAALKEGVEFVIATPGRFIDLYKEHVADLGLVRAVIFDEADRMFDMGFREDMKFILKRIPRERQFLVFSATLNFEVLNVAYENGADPVEVNVSREQAKAENVKDYMLHVGQEDKPRYLLSLIKKNNPRQAIIFSNFKHNVERIAKFLSSNGVPAMGISSLLTQAQRNRVMEQFKAENESNILVATDVAARGLDIVGVDLVLNFDLPDDAENYVHRIGRTGRAGAQGHAFSMVSDRDVDALQRIETYLGNKLENLWLDDTELVAEFKAFPRDEHRGRPSDRRPRPGGGEGRGGGDRGPRREGGGGRGGRDSNRPPRAAGAGGDRPGQRREGGERGPRREHGNGPRQDSHHRDRASGRHRSGGEAGPRDARPNHGGGSGGNRPRPNSGNGPRPQHARGGAQGGRPHNGPRPNRPGGGAGRPIPRNNNAAAAAANKGLGSKVSGFFKKLFGGKES